MTRVLLAGAAGFAGSHCLRHLLVNTDWQVICPVSLDHAGRMSRIGAAMAGQDPRRVTVMPCDLARPLTGKTRLLFGQPDHIINYASASHVDRSIADPVPFVRNNVDLILTLLEYARTIPGLRMFLHVNTDEVFGPSYDGELFTEDARHRPSNPYAASKSCQSQLGRAWWRTYQVPFCEVYCCNMLGEHQDPEKFVPLAVRALTAGEPVPVHTDRHGTPGSRFWQHARSVADAVLFLLTETVPARYGDGPADPSRYCVTSGDRVSNLDLAGILAAAAGREVSCDLLDGETGRPGHDIAYGLDGSRLAALGWKPPVSFAEGVRRTVARETGSLLE